MTTYTPVYRTPLRYRDCPHKRCVSVVFGNTRKDLDAAMTRHLAVCRQENR